MYHWMFDDLFIGTMLSASDVERNISTDIIELNRAIREDRLQDIEPILQRLEKYDYPGVQDTVRKFRTEYNEYQQRHEKIISEIQGEIALIQNMI